MLQHTGSLPSHDPDHGHQNFQKNDVEPSARPHGLAPWRVSELHYPYYASR